jgi:hypothetical protein
MPVSKIPGAGISGGSVTVNQTAPDNSLVIDSAGNVGVGTASPSTPLSGARGLVLNSGATNDNQIRLQNDKTGSTASDGFLLSIDGSTPPNAYVFNYENSSIVFGTNNTERMRIDGSGNLLVGTTSVIGVGRQSILYSGATNRALSIQTSSTDGNAIGFVNSSGTVVGNIYQNASSTAYQTSSDYRLKENIAPMTGALATVSQLKPVTYNWKVDGSSSQGFIAHELQAVVPDCVTGEKDAVDADGKPVYQGIDTSFLVATLTAAIQEQQQIINDLKARIETLEAK